MWQGSQRITRQALEQPLQQKADWTPLDLLIRAEARDLIKRNSQLCMEAVQSRFYGDGSLVFALQRLNRRIDPLVPGIVHVAARFAFDAWDQLVPLLKLAASTVASGTQGTRNLQLPAWLHSLERLAKAATEGVSMMIVWLKPLAPSPTAAPDAQGGEDEPVYSWKLLACLGVDAIGISAYIFPVLPAFFCRYIWPLIAAGAVSRLHNNTCLTLLVLIEEYLPLVEIIPSATIG